MMIWNSFLELFYPSLCVCCSKRLIDQETFICSTCLYNLPKTDHLNQSPNRLEKSFWGRFPFENMASFCYFSKEGIVQKIIHEIKYKKNQQLGFYMGELCGIDLNESTFLYSIDAIVPVPIHPKKLKKRGFNQALVIAKGISKETKIPIIENNLIRTIDNTSQTAKTRIERRKNIEHSFAVKDSLLFKGKHILIVDDVLTTGSTLEVCAKRILLCAESKISIYTIALTK